METVNPRRPHQPRTTPVRRYAREKSAGAVVYYRGRPLEFLLIAAGYWEFPKGRIDADESEVAAALREVREETGLAVRLQDGFRRETSYVYRHHRDGELVRKQVVYFLGEATTRDVLLSSEHQHKAWLPYEEARARLRHESSKQLLEAAHQFLRERSRTT
ncbi:MAG: NUDIX domain-containing protein [Chloroflexi bacterium]|nr:NUDIX domain-containing protein [Chloroflexota bacterium]